MKKTILLASLLVCLLTASSVFAGRMWYYSNVLSPSGETISSVSSAIGMRSDGTWPVVAYSNSAQASGVAVMLPGSWAGRVSTFSDSILDGATAPDGTAGFVDNYGSVVTYNGRNWGGGSVSSTTSKNKNSIAFNNESVPGVLYKSSINNNLTLSMRYGAGWASSTVQPLNGSPVTADNYALDFDSGNQANIVYRKDGHLAYGVNGNSTSGQWSLSEMPTLTAIGAMDIALSSNEDIPFIAYLSGSNTLKCATYNVQTFLWTSEVIDNSYAGLIAGNFTIAADETGGMGIAYVAHYDGVDMLSFAYNDGSGWSMPERLTAALSSYTVGLTFDNENNPVISYMDSATNRLKIAYDPYVPVPEPATMAIFALGLALIRRK